MRFFYWYVIIKERFMHMQTQEHQFNELDIRAVLLLKKRVVTEKDHSYYINSKVRGFCTALRAVIHETTGNGSTFAAIICEDAKGIQKVISMIQNIDEPLMKHCIFTTGTVLISRSALLKADGQ